MPLGFGLLGLDEPPVSPPNYSVPELDATEHQGRKVANYLWRNIMGEGYGKPQEDVSAEEWAYRLKNPSLMWGEPEITYGEIPDLWHGSPHKFKKFDWDKLGTGEGAAAFGAGGGGYHTTKKGIAKGYTQAGGSAFKKFQPTTIDSEIRKLDNATARKLGKEIDIDVQTPTELIDELMMFGDQYYYNAIGNTMEELGLITKRGSHLYQTTAFKGKDPSEYTLLDWYEPVTEKQATKIRAQAEKEGIDLTYLDNLDPNAGYSGREVYEGLAPKEGIARQGNLGLREKLNKKEASKFLKRAGIDGIRYPTETLSGKAKHGRDEFNYVIFDPKDVTIESIDGKKLIEKPAKAMAKSRNKIFDDIANAQRGKPEQAMSIAARSNISNIYGNSLEHIGDILHRMTEKPQFFKGGYENVMPKVKNHLRGLKQEYGFKKESIEQIESASKWDERYIGRHPKDLEDRLKDLSKKYSDEHRKLPVYNEMQYHAREAAVKYGEWDFDGAIKHLEVLKKELDKGPEHWEKVALKFTGKPFDPADVTTGQWTSN